MISNLKTSKRSILKNATVLQSQLRSHNLFTVKVNEIVVSSNDDKVLQTYDRITKYPYGTPTVKVYESQLLPPKIAHRILCDR